MTAEITDDIIRRFMKATDGSGSFAEQVGDTRRICAWDGVSQTYSEAELDLDDLAALERGEAVARYGEPRVKSWTLAELAEFNEDQIAGLVAELDQHEAGLSKIERRWLWGDG